MSLSRPNCLDPTLTPWTPVLDTPTTCRMWEPRNTRYNLDSEIALLQACIRGSCQEGCNPFPSRRMGTSSRYSLSLPDTIRLSFHVEGGMSLACPDPAAPRNVLGKQHRQAEQSCHLIGGNRSSLREIAFLWNCLSQSLWYV